MTPKRELKTSRKPLGLRRQDDFVGDPLNISPYITGKTSLLLPLTTKQDPSDPTPTQKTTIKSRYNTKRTHLKALESEEKADRFWRKRAMRWIPNQSGEQGDRNTVLLAEEIRTEAQEPLPLGKEESNPRRKRTGKKILKSCLPTSLVNSRVIQIWNKFKAVQIKTKYLHWN